MNNIRRTAGFTLIELMITITVLTIITSLAVPSFSNMIESNRRVSCANQLLGALQFARSEAVRRGRPINVSAVGESMSDGIEVKENTTLLQQTAACNGPQVSQTGGTTEFNFKPNGQTDLSSDTGLTISICKANSPDVPGRRIRVLSTGFVRSDALQPCLNKEEK